MVSYSFCLENGFVHGGVIEVHVGLFEHIHLHIRRSHGVAVFEMVSLDNFSYFGRRYEEYSSRVHAFSVGSNNHVVGVNVQHRGPFPCFGGRTILGFRYDEYTSRGGGHSYLSKFPFIGLF